MNRVCAVVNLILDNKVWEQMPKQLRSPPELNGPTMNVYKNNIYLFGGFEKFQKTNEMSKTVYRLDLGNWKGERERGREREREKLRDVTHYFSMFLIFQESNTWTRCQTKIGDLVPRAFHCACVHENFLVLWGGCQETGIQVLNLGKKKMWI